MDKYCDLCHKKTKLIRICRCDNYYCSECSQLNMFINLHGKKDIFCGKCADNMELKLTSKLDESDVYFFKSKCIISDCKLNAEYGYYSNDGLIHCELHKNKDYVYSFELLCKKDSCAAYRKKDDEFCVYHMKVEKS